MIDWGIISSILALVIGFLGTIGSVASPYLGKEKKLLIARRISDDPVVHEDAADRVKILFDNDPNPVENVNLLVLSLKSAGTTAILPQDYNPNIWFSFTRVLISAERPNRAR
jgi:hypothetical protein